MFWLPLNPFDWGFVESGIVIGHGASISNSRAKSIRGSDDGKENASSNAGRIDDGVNAKPTPAPSSFVDTDIDEYLDDFIALPDDFVVFPDVYSDDFLMFNHNSLKDAANSESESDDF